VFAVHSLAPRTTPAHLVEPYPVHVGLAVQMHWFWFIRLVVVEQSGQGQVDGGRIPCPLRYLQVVRGGRFIGGVALGALRLLLHSDHVYQFSGVRLYLEWLEVCSLPHGVPCLTLPPALPAALA
jgi:hypothetical protein